ncbi:hypothetical protein SAMN04488038_108125 [Solimonas aquatica]|uniref:Uncharacterized protein n=1 Tax=Solimonas aquatica TaxID=489703 RepID=A0A1H9HD58_9GAMM|nr:hypothetical protein SAMN04488038_108125 [Solimonas aquatica]
MSQALHAREASSLFVGRVRRDSAVSRQGLVAGWPALSLDLLPHSSALRRTTHFSLLVQREVSKRKHTPALAPASPVPSLCNVLGAVAHRPSMACTQLSRTSCSALPCARRTAQRQRRGPQHQKQQQLRARSVAALCCAVAFNPLCLAPSSVASAVGEPNRKFGSVAAAPWMARLQRPRARGAAQAAGAASAAPDARRRVCFLLGTSLCTSKEKYLGRRRAHETKLKSDNNRSSNSKAMAACGACTPELRYVAGYPSSMQSSLNHGA